MSEVDNASQRIRVESGRPSSAIEPPVDPAGGFSDSASDPDGGGCADRRTSVRQIDDSDLCHRQTEDEFLCAMKEDLGDWLGVLYGVDIGASEFFEKLETGVLLCRHANAVHQRLCHARTNDTGSNDYSTPQNTDDPSNIRNTKSFV